MQRIGHCDSFFRCEVLRQRQLVHQVCVQGRVTKDESQGERHIWQVGGLLSPRDMVISGGWLFVLVLLWLLFWDVAILEV